MIHIDKQTITILNQIRNQVSSLQPEDKETIIQSGASLESVYEEIPEETHGQVRNALLLCLQALQAIYQNENAGFERIVKGILGALIASEQSLGAHPNPISEMMLNQAISTLSKELESLSENEEIHEADVSEFVPTLVTLDDVSSFLIQLDLTDHVGLQTVCDALKNISASETDKDKRKLIVKSAREISHIINGKSENPQETFDLVSELIDKANRIENPPVETEESNSQTTLETAQKTKSDKNETDTIEQFDPDILPVDSDASLVSEFVIESFELLEAAEIALLALETDTENIENVNTVFRAFHTVKGSGAYLGFKRMTELAHHAESLLSRMRDREIRCSGGFANLALRSLDTLKEMLRAVEKCQIGATMKLPEGFAELVTILKNPENHGVSGATDFESKSIESADGVEISKSQNTNEAFSMEKIIEEALPTVLGGTSNQVLQNESKDTNFAQKGQSTDSSVRVRTDRLDRLIDMVGELVIAQSMLAQDSTVIQGTYHELNRKISHAGKIVRELQDLSMGMRMIPLKNTFQKMARLVRDVAKKCGKQVEFVTDGEETEIDRNMVDLIADPLVHMVRNAVDHGIENPENRAENGKSKIGKVKLAAFHAGGDVVVELTDDGAGLDPEKIVAKAIAQNLIESDKGMSENEIFRLIFAPGFSTAETLTDVSGRGVGMDVVRRNIEAMRGRVEISSEKGKGSVFTIRLPLTLAITDGMLVRVGSERYIVPTVNIQLSFQPNQKMISSVADRGELVSLRGELMPVFRLHQLFEVTDGVEDPTQGLLMIVADGRRRCALLVDELLGQQQVVTKTLGQGIGKIPGVSGGAILGDGCVGLILDTAEIVALARQNTSPIDRKEDSQKQQAA